MKGSPFLFIVCFALAREAVQAPTGTSISSASTLSRKSLFELVASRDAKIKDRTVTEQFRKDFANHPVIKKVNLHDEDRSKTIQHLLEIRKNALAIGLEGGMNHFQARGWGRKFTTSAYHLLSDPKLHPDLLKEYQAYTEHTRNVSNNEKKMKRYRSDEEGLEMKAKQRQYEKTLRLKRSAQAEEGSVMDRPMIRHLGKIATGVNKPTIAHVIQQGDKLGHLYTTGVKLRNAIEGYLKSAKYDQQEIKTALLQRGRVNMLARMRARNNKRRSKQRLSSQEKDVQKTGASRNEETLQSKRRRISEHLAKTDWHKTSNL